MHEMNAIILSSYLTCDNIHHQQQLLLLLSPGSEIVICTPGRMIDILTMNAGKIINLIRVTYIVLDEGMYN